MYEYQFSVDWFSQNIPFWLDVKHHLKPKKILEVGSFEGKSTCWMIKNFALDNPLEMYCIDTWEGSEEHATLPELKNVMPNIEERFRKNTSNAIASAKNEVKLHVLKGKSYPELCKLSAQGINDFDLIYIDGSHIASDVLIDACISFEMLRIKGMIIFDDYHSPNYVEDKPDYYLYLQKHPRLGIDSFIKCNADRLLIVNFDEEYNDQKYQMYLQKIA